MIELLFAFVCSNASAPAMSVGTPLSSLFLNTLSNFTVYLYGITNGIPCIKMKAYLKELSNLYGFKFVWVPVDKGVPPNATAVKLAEELGLPYVPIEGVYCGKRLVAVVIGDVENNTFWLNTVFKCTNETRIYKGTKLIATVSPETRGSSSPALGIFVLATIDSLNPVGLTIFILYLMVCMNVKGRCWKEALAFIVSYTMAHVLLGTALSVLPVSPYYPLIGIAISLIIILAVLRPSKHLRKFLSSASSLLSKLALRRESPIILGALAGTLGMSPCVVGTFLTAASAIGKSRELWLWGYYAIIYALTPTLLTIAVHKGKRLEPSKMILILAIFSLVVSVYMTLVNFGIVKIPSA